MTTRVEIGTSRWLSVEDGGQGPAVVFLHGLAGFKELWADTLSGLRQAGFRAIAYDHRGHGESTDVPPPWTIRNLADDLVLLLNALGVTQACLVGHSMGGRTLFQFALEHPDRLWAVVPVGAHSEAPRSPFREALAGVGDAALRDGLAGFRAAFEAAGLIPDRASQDPLFAQRFEAYLARNRTPMIAAAVDAILAMPVLTPRLGEIAVPALAVVGERDAPFRELTAWYGQAMPRCRTVVLPGCQHYPMTDQHDAFASALHEFLREVSAAHGKSTG